MCAVTPRYRETAVPEILIIDAYSVFFRAYYALPPMSTRAGQPTSALYGTCVMLLKLLRERAPKGLCFARDLSEPTFRHGLYPAYKQHRTALPSQLVQQLPLLDRLWDALQVPVFAVSSYEADDVIATLARELDAAGEQVCVVSGDRDLFQVVRPRVEVLFIGRRGQPAVTYDAAAVERRFGLPAHQLPSLVALVGDSSDNLPKVAGIGDKTAQRLIRRYGSIQGLLENIQRVSPATVREAVARAASQLRQNELLARLRSDVPLGDRVRYRPWTEASRAALHALFEELEFHSLLPRLAKLHVPA